MATRTTTRGQVFGVGIEMRTETCCSCHVMFALPEDLYQRRRDDHKTFYCPNGHGQGYHGKSDAEKLRDDVKWYEARLAEERQESQSARASLAATRGVVTKMRKRAIAGSCQFCHRNFANVSRHMASQHPNAAFDVEVP